MSVPRDSRDDTLPPSTDDIARVAARYGFELSPDEAELYRRQIGEALEGIDDFLASTEHQVRAPRYPGLREPGARPRPEEDPLNAWRWRCHIVGNAGGLLSGKTVSFKDNIAVADVPMTFATAVLEDFVPDFDATVVRRTLEEGGTVVGKNMMDGFSGGHGNGGAFSDYGPVLNPHALGHLTGGSSSGSAAAVATGEVDIAFGGDQSGSIRIPAAWCGTVGLKPTFGLVSHFGAGYDVDQSVDHVGPLARTVTDAARALQAVTGVDGLDPRQGRDVPETLDVLSGIDDGVRGLRIGVLTEGFTGAEPAVAQAVSTGIATLASLGAEVEHVSVPEHDTVGPALMAVLLGGSRASYETTIAGAHHVGHYPESLIVAVQRLREEHPESINPRRRMYVMIEELARRQHFGRLYARGHNLRAVFRKAVDEVLNEVDVLIMPTMLTTAPERRTFEDRTQALEAALGSPFQLGKVIRNTAPFSFTGHPALAMPCGMDGGLPISMQLVGSRFSEATLLRAARALEREF